MIDFVVVSSEPAAVCFGRLGKDRGRAVNRSPPGGELDLVARKTAGQTW